MVDAAYTLVMTPHATDGHSIRIVKGVNLCNVIHLYTKLKTRTHVRQR
jgi:hypothetical protein